MTPMQRIGRLGRTLLCAAAPLLVAVSPGARAEVAAADPIDAAMRACLARADRSTTAGQVQCMQTAQLGWQTAMNAAYRQVLAGSPPARRRAWEWNQKRWQAARDAQNPLYAAVFARAQGSINQITEADLQLQPVRDRALALRGVLARRGAAPARLRPCSEDALCEHAMFDTRRYYERLRRKLPARVRPLLWRAQQAWFRYLASAAAVTDTRGRIDIIGARVATLKRLSDAVGGD